MLENMYARTFLKLIIFLVFPEICPSGTIDLKAVWKEDKDLTGVVIPHQLKKYFLEYGIQLTTLAKCN